ncbi:hypothetical protein, partial [Planomonospora algeriensis]
MRHLLVTRHGSAAVPVPLSAGAWVCSSPPLALDSGVLDEPQWKATRARPSPKSPQQNTPRSSPARARAMAPGAPAPRTPIFSFEPLTTTPSGRAAADAACAVAGGV